jgi:hypothetical protein
MYVKIVNGQVAQYPYSVSALRRDNPYTSFPANMPDERLAEWGVFLVQPTATPEHSTQQKVVEGPPVLVDAVWQQTWVVQDYTPEETEDRAAQVRSQRTNMLAECDWTQLPDAPVDQAAWAAYRQALRDVSKQPGFPWTVEWPAQPE